MAFLCTKRVYAQDIIYLCPDFRGVNQCDSLTKLQRRSKQELRRIQNKINVKGVEKQMLERLPGSINYLDSLMKMIEDGYIRGERETILQLCDTIFRSNYIARKGASNTNSQFRKMIPQLRILVTANFNERLGNNGLFEGLKTDSVLGSKRSEATFEYKDIILILSIMVNITLLFFLINYNVK